jgi:hypothetical protein
VLKVTSKFEVRMMEVTGIQASHSDHAWERYSITSSFFRPFNTILKASV